MCLLLFFYLKAECKMIIYFTLAMKNEGTLLIYFFSEWSNRNVIFFISNFAAQGKEGSSAVVHKSSLWTLLIINCFAQHLCKLKLAQNSYNFTFFFFPCRYLYSSRLFVTRFVTSKPCTNLLPLYPKQDPSFLLFVRTPSLSTSPSHPVNCVM